MKDGFPLLKLHSEDRQVGHFVSVGYKDGEQAAVLPTIAVLVEHERKLGPEHVLIVQQKVKSETSVGVGNRRALEHAVGAVDS